MKFSPSNDGSLPISSYKELLEYEYKFRPTTFNSPVMMWMSGPDMSYNFFSKDWLDFTGGNFKPGKNSEWMNGIHPDDLNKYREIYVNSFHAKKQFYVEFRMKKHAGEYVTIAANGEPRYSGEGSFEGYIGTFREIVEPKYNPAVLEQKIKERTKALNETIEQLKQSNLELTQFAYVATHDLQEPLRKIKIFTERLLIKTSSKLNEDEMSYLTKIKSSTTRMSDLIKDVLDYSVLSRSHDSFTSTDLNNIIQNVLTDFELLITQKKAQFEIDRLPSIEALPLQMNQLFNNLISNSLKFTTEGVKPVITIKQLPVTTIEKKRFDLDLNMTYVKIRFTDNGIGFNREYSEKIFEIFQRLNGKEKYPGTGIGLALCKKIVNNHGGEIFAESSIGNGASFNLIFPLKQ